MSKRIPIAVLALVIAALPLAARADLYVNVIAMRVVWQGADGCTFLRTGGPASVYQCNKNAEVGSLMTLSDYGGQYRGTCTLKWWGTRGGHWHYEFKKNDFPHDPVQCSGYWQNSNTLDVQLKKK